MNLADYCAELSGLLKKKHCSQIYFVGSVLVRKDCSDVDIYVLGKDAQFILEILNGYVFSNGKELEALDSLSTDDCFNSSNESLTNFIIGNGMVKKIKDFDFNKLSINGLFLSKLACYEQRSHETLKDLDDLDIIYEKLGQINGNGAISEKMKKIIDEFDLTDAFIDFSEECL
ncbi:MAG: hypothetical protein PHT91_02475 [Candidatus Nanoarchaeia archaeon]|nr:hypothetical protein [Candidatus Nanoarchaeia archaeon]MDD5053902.1 hypothetical protein [Candidatus Nanoarchaeia archaeon]MDD5499717.1 hypothetical protein [Candidatus Nanoarchaeia archaeon]